MPVEKEAEVADETVEDEKDEKDKKDEVEVETPEKPKMVPLSELVDTRNKLKEARKQIEGFEAQKKAKDQENMSEVERLKAENATLKESLSNFEVGSKKQAAFLKAKGSIGDQYEIPAATEAKLLEKIGKLSFDPDAYESDIADLVEMAKRPRTSAKSVLTTETSETKTVKKAQDYTAQELRKLEAENPEKFKKVMAERRASVGFGTKATK